MMTWRILPLLLGGAMMALTPAAALASPPDQHWLGGLYDNADYDDAVLAVVESVACLDHQRLHDRQYVFFVVAFVLAINEEPHATPSLSSNHTRGPPTS